jgi:putative ABC transport system ATP-binding protein
MLLEIKDLTKYFGSNNVVKALDGINLSVEQGDFIGIMGPSGSGKTTLLNLISTIDKPTSGSISINGTEVSSLTSDSLASFRRRELGIVFQDFNLIDSLSVRENIMLPMILDKGREETMEKRLKEVAKILNISEILDKRPYEISGGEAQRTAIGRALFNSPQLLLADEPTGNLDSKNAGAVMRLFASINEQVGVTTMMVTHNPESASYCKRIIFIRDGKLYNMIERGESREQFFEQILHLLSFMSTK